MLWRMFYTAWLHTTAARYRRTTRPLPGREPI